MASVNRSALVVRPKQPFVDWINAVEPTSPVTLEQACDEPSVYLLPVCDTEKDLTRVLGLVYEEIFEEELWSWYTDPECWPKDRSLRVFRSWLDCQWHSMVVDLCSDPLMHEAD